MPSAEEGATALDEALPLGAARAQLHENYIIAQTKDGMILVDAHAAHERLVYERLKNQLTKKGVAAQALLIPEIIEMSSDDISRLLTAAPDLSNLGLTIEPLVVTPSVCAKHLPFLARSMRAQ